MTLYGKDGTVSLIRSMLRRDRLPHAFIFFGEKGVGKKTLARYAAQMILCEKGEGLPCGECLACRKIAKNIHPDFIGLTPGGKNGNYLSDELRAIVSDAAIAPNESEKKIYFLPGIDKSLPEAQNMLLKVVEEPPAHVMFLMTAESREKILPTILSRVISVGITEPSPEQCVKALIEAGYSPDSAEKASEVFGGNIGKCAEYIENGCEAEYLDAVRQAVSAMTKRDEFLLNAAFASVDGKQSRGRILDVLSALKDVMRDVTAKKLGASLCSVYKEGAAGLADRLRQSSVDRIYEALGDAERKINGNGSQALVLSELSAKIAVNL